MEPDAGTCMSLVQAVQAMEENETYTKYRRAVIEVCCGAQSHLSRARPGVTDDCFCFRVTQADDFTLDSTVDAVIAILHLFKGACARVVQYPLHWWMLMAVHQL